MPTIFRQRVTINGVAFNDDAAKPAGAVNWILDVMDGWDNTPDPDVRMTPLGVSRDGSSSADFFAYPNRVLTIGGAVYASSAAVAETLRDLLLSTVMPRNKNLEVTRQQSSLKFLTARRAGVFETDWPMDSGFRWQTTLMADDPFKYSSTTVSGSAGVSGNASYGYTFPHTFPLTYTLLGSGDVSALGIVNAGTVSSRKFTVSITGPLTAGGWRLRNDTNGGELGFDVGLLSSTDVLLIDFMGETVLLNGYPIAYTLSGDFWGLDPGSNTIRLYADYNATTQFTVVARSAWE